MLILILIKVLTDVVYLEVTFVLVKAESALQQMPMTFVSI